MGTEVQDTLAALRAELAKLSERMAGMEAALRNAGTALGSVSAAPPAAPAPAPAKVADKVAAAAAKPAANGEISEETLLVISAAVAAFLGKKAKLRGIRVLSSASWAHQGRVSIQASHAFNTHSR